MKPLLILPFLLFATIANAKNYYISQAGNDTNNGLTTTTAWKNLTKLNASFGIFQSGDSILFNSGETFYGSIIVNKSNIVFGSYGTGAKPIITGFTTIKGWTNEGRGIYSKIITSSAQTNMVTIDGVQVGMGRYPDANYLSYESFATNISITDNGLGTSTNWAGAEVAIRKNDWALDRCLITNHTGDILTYTSLGNSGNGTSGYGYFIQNDLRTLTTYGEWYHNTGTGKFYMYFGVVDPNTKVVKVATLNNLVTNTGFDYITFNNINFNGSISNLISFTSATDYCTIQNCSISFAGNNGISLPSGTGVTIYNNSISYCNRIAITTDATNTSILNNTIFNTGSIAGQTFGADGYNAIYILGNAGVIRYNTIRNTGSTGIVLKRTGTVLIQNNFIDSACTVTNDGAGIYTSGINISVRTIDGNIITNTIGNVSGTTRTNSICAGIYLDEVSTNCIVTNNTVSNAPDAGIKLHKAHDNIITDNTCYNNGSGIYFLNSSGSNIVNNSVRRNIFFAKTTTQVALKMSSVANDLTLFGTADSNYYVRPIDDSLVFYLNQPSTGLVYKNLSLWKTFSTQDANSKKSPKTIASISELDFQYNATAFPITYNYNGLSKIGVNGVVYNNSASIPAYSSFIFFDNGNTISIRPYYIKKRR